MRTAQIIDYGQVVKDYNNFILGGARGFKAPAAFLAMWMPDETPLESVLNMIIAAQDWGEATVVISFDKQMLEEIEIEDLARRALEYGSVDFETSNKYIQINVRFK